MPKKNRQSPGEKPNPRLQEISKRHQMIDDANSLEELKAALKKLI